MIWHINVRRRQTNGSAAAPSHGKTTPVPYVSFESPSHPASCLDRPDTDNAGVIVNVKGDLKGSAISGPVAKECADLWPRIASAAGTVL
eukprot:1350962-Pleurochrysis_carterae.AAC.1